MPRASSKLLWWISSKVGKIHENSKIKAAACNVTTIIRYGPRFAQELVREFVCIMYPALISMSIPIPAKASVDGQTAINLLWADKQNGIQLKYPYISCSLELCLLYLEQRVVPQLNGSIER